MSWQPQDTTDCQAIESDSAAIETLATELYDLDLEQISQGEFRNQYANPIKEKAQAILALALAMRMRHQ